MRTKLKTVLCDPARLGELRRLHLLDTPPEPPFDRLTRLAARVLAAPVALMSLVDDRRQFFKSAFGLDEPLASRRETPLTHSFCKFVVANAAPLAIEDATQHPLVCDSAAIGSFGVMAYLGVPLTTQNGGTLGSFCVLDVKPRKWADADLQAMIDLAASVMSEIALKWARSQQPAEAHSVALDPATREQLLGLLRECDGLLRSAQNLSHAAIELINPIANRLANSMPHEKAAQRVSLEQQRLMLTGRQRDVFDLLMHGLQTKEVAQRLNLSPRTIETHRAHILERLHVISFSQLIKELLVELEQSH